jgi:hypothetical protein
MANKTEYSRLRLKRSTITGVEPTIPTGTTIDNTWLPTDLLIGEGFINVIDDRLWYRTANGLIEVPLSGFSSSNYYTDSAFLSGSTVFFNRTDTPLAYSVDLSSLISGSDNYVTGGTYNSITEELEFTGTNLATTFNVDVSALLDDTNTYVTGGTFSTGTLTLDRNDANQVVITGFTDNDTFTTGATLNGNVIEFDRTDLSNAYNVDLTSLLSGFSTTDYYVTGGTYSTGTLTLDRNDGNSVTVTGFTDNTDNFTTGGTYNSITEELEFTGTNGATTFNVDVSALLDDTNTFTTGATLSGNTIIFDRNDLSNAYNVDLSSLQFTGNTSGNCITDLYVTNLYGCSPITINDDIEITNDKAIKSSSGNSYIDLRAYSTDSNIHISTDGDNYSEAGLYIMHTPNTFGAGSTELYNYDGEIRLTGYNQLILDEDVLINCPIDFMSGESGNISLITPQGNIIFEADELDLTNVTSIIGLPADANTFVTGGTFSTGTLTLDRNDNVQITVTGFTDNNFYTTGATLSGNTIVFDRTDLSNAYNIDLTPIIPTGSTTPTLAQVLTEDNQSNGNNIFLNEGDNIGNSNGNIDFASVPYGAVLETDSIDQGFGSFAVYTLSPDSTSGIGTGLVLTIARNTSTNVVSIAAIDNGGQDYEVNDTITFLGSDFGLTSPADDETWTITKIDNGFFGTRINSDTRNAGSFTTDTLIINSAISGTAINTLGIDVDGNVITTPNVVAVDNFTTGATLSGNTIIFDRTDLSNAYNVDLTSIIPSVTNVYNSDGVISGVTRTVTIDNSDLIVTGDSSSSISYYIVDGLELFGSLIENGRTFNGYVDTGSPTISNGVLSIPNETSLNYYDGVLTGDRTTLRVGKAFIIAQSDDTLFEGIKYNVDYSSNYSPRSLVDKAYVDGVVSGITDNNFYTTGATLSGNTIIFDRTDLSNAYSVDLTSIIPTGSTTTPTLAQVLAEDNETNGNDIKLSDGDKIFNDDGADIIDGLELDPAFNNNGTRLYSEDTVSGEISSIAIEPTAITSQVFQDAQNKVDLELGVLSSAFGLRNGDLISALELDPSENNLGTRFYIEDVVSGDTSEIKLTTTEITFTSDKLIGLPYDTSFAVSDEETQITSGTSKITLFASRDFEINKVKVSLTTTGSTTTTVDVNINGSSILTSPLDLTSGNELASETGLTVAVDEDDKITVDIDVAGTGATGLKVYLIGKTL